MSAKPKTFYEILDVPNTASENEIKKAFRTLSLKFHPDRNKAPDAQSTFQTINEAYETLSDPAKRNQYDMELKGGVFPGMFPGAPDDIGNIFNMILDPVKSASEAVPKSILIRLKSVAFEPNAGNSPFV